MEILLFCDIIYFIMGIVVLIYNSHHFHYEALKIQYIKRSQKSTPYLQKKISGLLRTAIEERQLTQVTDTFSEWFKLAKDQGIVKASQGTKNGINWRMDTSNHNDRKRMDAGIFAKAK